MIAIHPAMTAEQIADWCARHKMIVTIEYVYDPAGKVAPMISAREDHIDPMIPAFIRANRFDQLPSLLRFQAE